MNISFILPSRNNLKYLKWSYDSIRKNQSNHVVEICVADDFSNDGTWDWCTNMMNTDKHFKAIRNDGPNRLGHTILYDRLVNDVSTNDICMIYHADMYLCPEALDSIAKNIELGKIVSLTRIEPPLHPPGPEKVFIEWGATEPENFDEAKFLKWFNTDLKREKNTEGVFAPWAFYKKDFQDIGGHDSLYAPQSKEDSDIFNRFQLNGIKFIQTWEGFVYHMTCRGSRFNPLLTTPGKNSNEWESQNLKSSRNFIRKWGHFVKHDELMKPIIPPKYNIGFIIKNCNSNLLELLEPWCDNIYIEDVNLANEYISREQINTKFILNNRVKNINNISENDVLIEFDGSLFKQEQFNFIQNLSEIISSSAEVGIMEYDIFKFTIESLNTYEKKLITCNN